MNDKRRQRGDRNEKDPIVTESSKESFPASDPPAFNPGVAAPIETPESHSPRPATERKRKQRNAAMIIGIVIAAAIIALLVVSGNVIENAENPGLTPS